MCLPVHNDEKVCINWVFHGLAVLVKGGWGSEVFP